VHLAWGGYRPDRPQIRRQQQRRSPQLQLTRLLFDPIIIIIVIDIDIDSYSYSLYTSFIAKIAKIMAFFFFFCE